MSMLVYISIKFYACSNVYKILSVDSYVRNQGPCVYEYASN